MTGQVYTLESKTYTWTLKGEMNTSIKEKEKKEKGIPERRENPAKGRKGKGTMLLGRCPRT